VVGEWGVCEVVVLLVALNVVDAGGEDAYFGEEVELVGLEEGGKLVPGEFLVFFIEDQLVEVAQDIEIDCAFDLFNREHLG